MNKIIRKYKGYEIKKYEKRYSCKTSWTEKWYEIKGINKQFDKLKQAKEFIDYLEAKEFIDYLKRKF